MSSPLAVVDTHVHLWDPDRLSYPWLKEVPPIQQAHLLEDYRAAIEGIPIERMVFLQCECDPSQYLEEACWVSALARDEPRLKGMVPWAPLEKGADVLPELETLTEDPLVKGIRRIVQFEEDDHFCLQPSFVEGVQLLAQFDLHFEICTKGNVQMANVVKLVRQCPNVRFILDHIGKPFIKEKETKPWEQAIRELAELPNTRCKISGLVNEADWESWQPADLQPYLHHVIESFGFKRVMFGGDWPVVKLASSYRRWFDTLVELTRQASAEERRMLFHDNAMSFYRLED